jgi:hypothetical protein
LRLRKAVPASEERGRSGGFLDRVYERLAVAANFARQLSLQKW